MRTGGNQANGMPMLDRPYAFLEAIKQLPYVTAIYLFGSRARGDAREKSDIDLAIAMPQTGPVEWDRVQSILDAADTLLFIDAVRYDILTDSDPLKQAIDRDKQILFQRV